MLEASVYVVFLAVAAAYASPSLIAVWNKRETWLRIAFVNILLGWTVVGWLLALAMALNVRFRRPTMRPGRSIRRRKAAAAPGRSRSAAAGSASDPPPILEDAYAGWLDRGEAMPSESLSVVAAAQGHVADRRHDP